jgi:hypothetical protein
LASKEKKKFNCKIRGVTMTPGASCPDVVGEFRVMSEHIGTRDLVQEYLANRVFPMLR